MRLTWLDGVGTLLVAAIVAIYAAFVAFGEVPVRGIALLGLVLGFAAYLEMGPGTDARSTLPTVTGVFGLAASGLGIATVTIGSELLLTAFIGGIVTLWLVVILRGAGVVGSEEVEIAKDITARDGSRRLVTSHRSRREHRRGPLATS